MDGAERGELVVGEGGYGMLQGNCRRITVLIDASPMVCGMGTSLFLGASRRCKIAAVYVPGRVLDTPSCSRRSI